ncbi:MAG: GAF domain-containing protein, partial [Deltaproteobacteria bacterium]|nr:GAF domain-containing protein [Deltaproteobacteria bacterium]
MKKKEKPEQAKRVLRKSKGNQRLAQETETIAEIGRIISSSLNIEEVYERFAQEAKKLIEFDRIVINIINHKDRTVSVPYMSGMAVPGRQPGETFLLADSPNEEVVRIKKYLLIHLQDAGEISARYPSMLPHFKIGLRSSLRVPLISKEQVIGVLGFLSKKPKAYGERDIKLVENIGYQIAGAIANAQLFLEQKRAEEAAQRLAQETTSIAEIGRIISSTLNIDEIYDRFAQEVKKLIEFDRISINHINPKENTSIILFTWGTTVSGRQSREFFPLAGSATGEVLKARASLIIQPDDEKDIATRLPAFLPVLQAGLRSTMAVPLISKGEMIAALFFYSKRPKAYTDQDLKLAESIGYQIAGAIANAQLFLDHKRDREALRESEWRFRIAAENASDLIWEWDIGKEVLTWFGHIDEKLGYQPGEFPRTIEAWENVIHPEDHDCVMKALDRHLENQERFREEYRVLRKDGTILYWIDSGTAVYDPGGKPYKMIGSVTDITERKKMEEELLRSKKLESVGFLSGGIAHDFNNLLTG